MKKNIQNPLLFLEFFFNFLIFLFFYFFIFFYFYFHAKQSYLFFSFFFFLSQTRVLVAESIRRNIEMSEMSQTDADSDAGLPDDSDEADDEIEV